MAHYDWKWKIECLTEKETWRVWGYATSEDEAREKASKAMLSSKLSRCVRFRRFKEP